MLLVPATGEDSAGVGNPAVQLQRAWPLCQQVLNPVALFLGGATRNLQLITASPFLVFEYRHLAVVSNPP